MFVANCFIKRVQAIKIEDVKTMVLVIKTFFLEMYVTLYVLFNFLCFISFMHF
jgi:hypothetical protein